MLVSLIIRGSTMSASSSSSSSFIWNTLYLFWIPTFLGCHMSTFMKFPNVLSLGPFRFFTAAPCHLLLPPRALSPSSASPSTPYSPASTSPTTSHASQSRQSPTLPTPATAFNAVVSLRIGPSVPTPAVFSILCGPATATCRTRQRWHSSSRSTTFLSVSSAGFFFRL